MLNSINKSGRDTRLDPDGVAMSKTTFEIRFVQIYRFVVWVMVSIAHTKNSI